MDERHEGLCASPRALHAHSFRGCLRNAAHSRHHAKRRWGERPHVYCRGTQASLSMPASARSTPAWARCAWTFCAWALIFMIIVAFYFAVSAVHALCARETACVLARHALFYLSTFSSALVRYFVTSPALSRGTIHCNLLRVLLCVHGAHFGRRADRP